MYTEQDYLDAKARTKELYEIYLDAQRRYNGAKAVLDGKANKKKKMEAAYKAWQQAFQTEKDVHELIKNSISIENQQTYYKTVELAEAVAGYSSDSNTWVWVLVLVVVAVGGFIAYKKFKK